jgi:hypothetical protein
MTAYDRQTFARSLALGITLGILVLAVMIATDGAMTTSSEKLGRLCVLAPLIGALGALAANAQASLRGEVRALAAVGVPPSRAFRGGLLAVLVLGALGSLVLALNLADVDGLLPRLEGAAWTPEPDGSYWSAEAGVVVDPSGTPRLTKTLVSHEGVSKDRWPIVISVLWMTLVLADWVREEAGGLERLLIVLAGGGLTIVLFHLVASERTSSWVLMLAPVPLLLQVWARRGWRRAQEKHRSRSDG